MGCSSVSKIQLTIIDEMEIHLRRVLNNVDRQHVKTAVLSKQAFHMQKTILAYVHTCASEIKLFIINFVRPR